MSDEIEIEDSRCHIHRFSQNVLGAIQSMHLEGARRNGCLAGRQLGCVKDK